jgi:hypothetical protein
MTFHHNWLDVVREVFPEATTAEALNILWEHTSYPLFNGGEDHHRIEDCRKQLEALKAMV